MAEAGKKAKAPVKSRNGSTAKSTAPKTAGRSTDSVKTAAAEKIEAYRPTHEEIAALAQRYWAERGHTDGQAEQDWLRAEQELMKVAS